MRFVALHTLALLTLACSKQEPPPAGDPATSAPSVAPAPAVEQAAFAVSTAVMLRQPSDEKKVKAEDGKEVANWMATLYRGEEVVLLKQEGEYAQVRSSDEKVGWMKASAVIAGEGVIKATVLEEVSTYSRPALLAPAKAKIAPGSVLYVLKTKDDFTQVNYAATLTAWVLTASLITDSREIVAAGLVSRARALDERKDEQAKLFWDTAREKFGDTQLVQKLANTEGTPAEGAETGAPDHEED